MVELKIVMSENGNVEVTGPIANKIQCYSMLEMARDAIKDFNNGVKKGGIVSVPAGALELLKS